MLNEAFALNDVYMVPFHQFTTLGSSGVFGKIDALVPLQLIGNEGSGIYGSQEFMRHMNMYRQFRVKCIRFEYTPTNAVTGIESNMTVQGPGQTVTADDATSKIINRNTNVSATYWIVKWPNKQGQFQDWGLNLSGTTALTGNIKNLNMLVDPSCVKVPVCEKFVLFWKPRLMGRKLVSFMPTQFTSGVGESANFMPKSITKSIKFPWVNTIDNYDSGHVVADSAYMTGQNLNDISVKNNMTGLWSPMSQPIIALYDSVANEFLNSEEAKNYCMGRWRIHTVFEFRHKVGYTQAIEQIPPDATAMQALDTYYDEKQNF